MSEYPTRDQQESGTVERAKGAAAQTAGTAREQARQVGGEVRTQTTRVVRQLRDRAREQGDAQSRRAARNIRQWADDLTTMRDNAKPDSPTYDAVHQVATGGRRAADYLEERGVSGMLTDVQRFARRRPGLFLAGALAAGFLAGRAAKAAAEERRDEREEERGYQGYGQGYGQADTIDYGRQSTSTSGEPYGGTGPAGTPSPTTTTRPAGPSSPSAPTSPSTPRPAGGTPSTGPAPSTTYPAGGPSTGRPGDDEPGHRPGGEPR